MENDITTPSPEKLQAQSDHATLTEIFEQHYGGCHDAEALQNVQRLCFSLSCSAWGVMAEKVHSIAGWAAILYSDRKHARWGVNGVELVRSLIWEAMSSLGLSILWETCKQVREYIRFHCWH